MTYPTGRRLGGYKSHIRLGRRLCIYISDYLPKMLRKAASCVDANSRYENREHTIVPSGKSKINQQVEDRAREKSKLTSDSILNGIDVADYIVGTGNPGVGLASVVVFNVACAISQGLRERPLRAYHCKLGDSVSRIRNRYECTRPLGTLRWEQAGTSCLQVLLQQGDF